MREEANRYSLIDFFVVDNHTSKDERGRIVAEDLLYRCRRVSLLGKPSSGNLRTVTKGSTTEKGEGGNDNDELGKKEATWREKGGHDAIGSAEQRHTAAPLSTATNTANVSKQLVTASLYIQNMDFEVDEN
ncbi:hypothetical protein HN873_062691 [Arachis hypogaea]